MIIQRAQRILLQPNNKQERHLLEAIDSGLSHLIGGGGYMPSTVPGPAQTEIHHEAEAAIRKRVREFAVLLIYEAKSNAFRNGAGVVDLADVDQAVRSINATRARSVVREAFTVLGGAMLGAWVEGLILQMYLSTPVVVVVWALSGIAGTALVVRGVFGGTR